MTKELVGITSGLLWLRTNIHRVGGWLQTDLYFHVDGRSFSVAFDALPDRAFLLGVTTICSLSIHEEIDGEGGDSGSGRYRIQFLSGDPQGEHTAYGSYVRYGPINNA